MSITIQRIQSLGIKPPTPSDHVYRDDCVYSFDTPESPYGLDVCLQCYLATSPDPAHNFTNMHFELTNHSLFVNISKSIKDKVREKSPTKMAKLSIEAQRDEDMFNTITKIKDVESNTELQDYQSISQLKDTVDGILSSTSYSQRQEIQAWEQEIKPCSHTLHLEQDLVSKVQNLTQCSKCDLQENLWICLVCGNLGCGRAQFGGVGGNGHGLEHFESSGHPVSVKLGSITPEGLADAFCYVHGDEVLDPALTEHLHHFGINIAEREKTEKSLTELQIEQNLKWDFSLTAEDGTELEPLFGPGLTGLKNLGNSCYISSVIQCLFSLPQFQQRYSKSNMGQSCREPAQDLEVQLRKVADGLLSGRYSYPDKVNGETNGVLYQKGLSLGMLKAVVGRGNEEFSSMRQQDAFEFLIYILEKMSKDSKNKSMVDVTKIFQFQTEQRLECLNCHAVRYKTEDQENLSIPVPANEEEEQTGQGKVIYKPVLFSSCLDNFIEPIQVEYKCPTCKSSTPRAVTSTKFKSFPDILVVNARRFKVINWVPQKLDIPVNVPEENMLLDSYLSLGPQSNENVVEDEEEEDAKFVANETVMQSLEAMGFPRVRCEKALFYTGNSDSESAMNWLFQHMEDPDIDIPLDSGSDSVSKEQISQLIEMGFSENQATNALKAKGSVEAALEYLFTNSSLETEGNEPSLEMDSRQLGDPSLPALYRLKGIICHKGGSIHAGHYVAFIRVSQNDDEKWVLFNDEKVVKGGEIEEMKKYAYVYFFERVK